MKNQWVAHLLYGLAAASTVWSFYEFFHFLVALGLTNPILHTAVNGTLLGLFFGVALLIKDGFLSDSVFKLKRGALYGLLFGLCGGVVSFFLIELILRQFPVFSSNTLMHYGALTFQWLILAVFLGLGFGLREGSVIALIRGLIAGGVAGVTGGLAMSIVYALFDRPFWARGIGFLVFAVLFSIVLYSAAAIGRKVWLRCLNGKYEGVDFELTKEIHFLGTQSNDDINLKTYLDIRPTHAKLVRYFSGYSLVDNDPFWQTFVNFRNIREQPLKNGDIIKIGKALFQYCMVEPPSSPAA
jgi:hypothetical protein